MLEAVSTVLRLSVLELVIVVVVVVGLVIATALVTARRGTRSLRQRLQALGSRLGADAQPRDVQDLEDILVHVERATDRAAETVAESSSEAIRGRLSAAMAAPSSRRPPRMNSAPAFMRSMASFMRCIARMLR